MLEAIRYRGPDSMDVKSFRSARGSFLTVGQARLAVIDPRPEANQPFESRDGKSCLTFNGEFFNFLRLRESLEAEGETFETRSDTEVALRCLDRNGMDALDRLWGQFAGAYFRENDGCLHLFRDRLGQKPLYTYRTQDHFYFASEPKAILRVLDHVPLPDPEALRRYFYLGYIPSDYCAYAGMRKLAAGHFLSIDPALRERTERWYFPEKQEILPESSLEGTFLDAVSIRMIADVPLAAFLSGGLDSSLVVAAMSRMAAKPVSTFSIRFVGPQVLDESKYARQVARHCGTSHHEFDMNLEVLKKSLPEVLDHFDEPFGDASAIPTFLVSREARRQFTVALSGDGADEVFAGYRKYLGPHYLRRLGPYSIRRFLWKPLSRLLPTGRTGSFLEANRRIRRLLQGDAPSAAERHVRLLHMSPVPGETLLGSKLREGGFNAVRESLRQRLPDRAGLNDCLRFDQDLVLQDDMFVKVDRMSMKASLEVRSPFIDHRLVNMANALPAERKLYGTQRKRILLETLGHWLPPEILNRPKTGFEMPLGAWLRGDLKTWTEHRLLESPLTEPWVDRTALRAVWRLHLTGNRDCTETLWYHLVFATWLQGVYG